MSENIVGLNVLLDNINNVYHNLSIERIPDKILLLMGQTKAGKTTLLYYLLKKKLNLQINQMGVIHMKPQALYLEAQVGNGYQSTTVYPNIPLDIDEDECLIIDMPGFNDTRCMYRFLNIYIIRSVFKNIKRLHVSFVIPFQSLEGDALLSALQDTCPLFNSNFLKKQRSFSFILTKIQDQQDNKNTFLQQMQYLKESELGEQLVEVMNSFAQKNTYTFCNSQPKLLEGAQLKKQIIRQNNFYQIDQDFENILSHNYADIIIGKGDRQEFHQYLIKVVQQLKTFLPQILTTFNQIVNYQYQQLLIKCGDYQFDYQQFSDKIENLKTIGIQVAPQWTSIRESIQIQETEKLLKNFVSKMKRIQPQTRDQNERAILRIKSFVDYSKELSQQECGVSDLLRDLLYNKLRNCYILIQTLNSIRSKLQIEEAINQFLSSQTLDKSISSYYSFITDSDSLAKLMEIPQAKDLMVQDENFCAIIASYDSKYVPSQGEVITKVVQQKTRDKLKNKQFQKVFLQSSKSAKPLDLQKPGIQRLPSNISSQLQQIAQQIQKLPNNHYTLELLLQSLNNMKNVNTNDFTNAKFLNNLLKKSVKLLSSLSLIEYAVSFSIAIPDYNQIQQLVQVGIKFALISPEFIKQILLPYISFVQYDFQLVQKLHNFLNVRAESMDQILELEQSYVDLISQMRKNLTQNNFEYERKRYYLELINDLISGEGSIDLLKQVERRCQQLRKNYLCSNLAQKQLAQLTHIS